jgi:hypothetical protein
MYFCHVHFHELADATPRVHAADPNALPVFPSYRAALLDMLPTLADPRVGGHLAEQSALTPKSLFLEVSPCGPMT